MEDNWLQGKRLSGGSFDSVAGSPINLFDFDEEHAHTHKLLLDPSTGETTHKEN
jgi:acid phosphatase/phospholipase C